MAWLAQQNKGALAAAVIVDPASAVKPRRPTGELSMYTDPPEGEVAIEEFERVALDRLRVLKGIEDARSRGKKPEELQALIKELVATHLTVQGDRDASSWRDQVSHFVLRLAYCRTEELRRWLLAQECALFQARFREELSDVQTEFMRSAELPYAPLAPGAMDGELRGALAAVQRFRGDMEAANAVEQGGKDHQYYEVPFEQVPDLVASRRVFLRRGLAYVAKDQIASLVVAHFRTRLAKGLALTARRWATHIADAEADRLTPVVESLSSRRAIMYLGPDYGDGGAAGAKGVVRAAEVPALARASFPLCMRAMYEALHAEHHLRHSGRMELGLFLKGIGLPVEEAMTFWRAEFAPRTPGDKFEKQYAYNIRHNYGKEGNRKSYTPYSCLKVISATPGVGDVHGCPYKTLDKEALAAALARMRIAPHYVSEAVTKAKAGHYQLACGVAFEGQHGGCACDAGINHPNQYFEESRKLLDPDRAKDAAEAAPSVTTPQQAAPASAVVT